MKRTVSAIILILISTFVCFGQSPVKYTPIKAAIQQTNYQTFYIKAHFAGIYDSSNLIFFVEEDDYIIPVQLQKKDLGAEKRFLTLDLKEGDVIVVRGRLNDIDIDKETYKGLADAVIIGKEDIGPDKYEKEEHTFSIVDAKPKFQGGDANTFSEWVNSQLIYPPKAEKYGIQGCVTVQFSVERDGQVTDVIVLHGVEESLDKEAVRVISNSPRWEPAYQNGEPVRVTYTFPVIFQVHW